VIRTLSYFRNEKGFTIMELMVASTLSGIMMALIVGNVLSGQTTYSEDVIRTKINSNLRSSMDIMSMNIRQAGENLPVEFEVVKVLSGLDEDPDELTLRRNLVSDVFTICHHLAVGGTQVYVSSTSLTDTECQIAGVRSTQESFKNHRLAQSGNVKVFLYNRTSGSGEFVDYTFEGEVGTPTQLYLTIGAPVAAYNELTSNVYLIEEWHFQLNTITNTLELFLNGNANTAQAVAFDVSDFQVRLEMNDLSYIDALDGSHPTLNWKNIRQVEITLEGEDQRKNRIFNSSITAQYFPRNVLSY